MKNIQPIVSSAYEAFVVAWQNKANQVTAYFRKGLTHTTGANIAGGGGLYGITFTGLLECTIGGRFLVHSETENISGVSGGPMDDGTIIIFYVVNHVDGSRDIYMIKGDADNNFGTPVLFDWAALAVKLTGGFFFGSMITGDIAGEYYHIMYQVGTGRYRTSIVKTTDYWQTYSEIGVLYDGNISYSETAGINLGGGNFLALSRNNISGSLTPFESTNHGVSWVRKQSCNLYWWNGGGPEIPDIDGHDGVFDIFFECRDTSMMLISKGNTLADNFGKAIPVYNPPEIYCYHRGTGTNPSLGYGKKFKMSNAKFFTIFFKRIYK
jgi:hypothetical protein